MNFEQPPIPVSKQETENETNETLIKQANSFEALASLIENKKISIQGSQEVFTPEMLKNIVVKIQSREWALNAATRRNGFRDKIAELLNADNNVDLLKHALADVDSKLLSESYVAGASTDNPLNKQRDERLSWKSRLESDIQRIEDKNSQK